ncbi:Endonuclease III-like protein 1 [Xylographa trunciseda]|nr:Endonuclease III-like protein 1 [Xylographa trunciseda]
MTPLLSFLDLPQDIRVTIYGLAGIVRQCPIDLVRECRRGAVIRSIPELQENRFPLPKCRYGPPQLQERTVELELPMDFECYCDAVPLQLLTCCRTVYHEAIHLLYARNVFKLSWWNLPAREALQRLSATAMATLTALQIDLGSIDHNSRMSVTEEDVERLFEIITTKCTTTKLNFTYICDIIERKHVRALSQPFKRLTNLRSCAVRLNTFPDVALEKLAKTMVLGATNHGGRVGGFPFMRLPREIRYQILELTDLVARWRDRRWADDGLVIQDGGGLPDSKPKYCCTRCTSSLAFCCCPQINASFSESCSCFVFPTSFFRVSRQFAMEAREVFLSQNRFIFTGNPYRTILFFQNQPAEMLHYIRKIDFQLSISDVLNWPRPDNGGLHAWRTIVTFIAEHLNIPNLFLCLDAGQGYQLYNPGNDDSDHARNFCHAVIAPLREDLRFRHLRRFHVFWARFNQDEAEAERAVKGPDYDSAREGKLPPHIRNAFFPHGVPHPSLAGENTMDV